MGRHQHLTCVRSDGLSAVLRPLLDDRSIVAATLVDVDSGLVLDGYVDAPDEHPSLADLELLGASHADMVRAAAAVAGPALAELTVEHRRRPPPRPARRARPARRPAGGGRRRARGGPSRRPGAPPPPHGVGGRPDRRPEPRPASRRRTMGAGRARARRAVGGPVRGRGRRAGAGRAGRHLGAPALGHGRRGAPPHPRRLGGGDRPPLGDRVLGGVAGDRRRDGRARRTACPRRWSRSATYGHRQCETALRVGEPAVVGEPRGRQLVPDPLPRELRRDLRAHLLAGPAKSISRSSSGTRTCIARRARRRISIRLDCGTHTARWSKPERSKSAPSTRLSTESTLRLNAAVTPCGVVVGRDQRRLVLDEVGPDEERLPRLEGVREGGEEGLPVGGLEVAERPAEQGDQAPAAVARDAAQVAGEVGDHARARRAPGRPRSAPGRPPRAPTGTRRRARSGAACPHGAGRRAAPGSSTTTRSRARRGCRRPRSGRSRRSGRRGPRARR